MSQRWGFLKKEEKREESNKRTLTQPTVTSEQGQCTLKNFGKYFTDILYV